MFILSFLLGLLAVAATVGVVVLGVIGFKCLRNYIEKRLNARKNHRVVFVDTKKFVDDYIQNMSENANEISMEELERICEDKPYVSAYVDNETGEITDYEALKAEKIDNEFDAKMKQKEGILIFE